jgi:predicted RNA-binding Zn-ribbon protein involved in translation (DUF1610 family)
MLRECFAPIVGLGGDHDRDIETLIGTIARETAAPFLDFACPACGKAKIVRVLATAGTPALVMCDECGTRWPTMQAVLDHAFKNGLLAGAREMRLLCETGIRGWANALSRKMIPDAWDESATDHILRLYGARTDGRRDAPSTEVPDSRRSDDDAARGPREAPLDHDPA